MPIRSLRELFRSFSNPAVPLAVSLALAPSVASSATEVSPQESAPPLESSQTSRSFTLGLNPSLASLSSSSGSLQAAIVGVSGLAFITDRIAAGLDFEEAFSLSGFSAAYTGVGVEGVYALTGSLRARQTEVKLGETPVLRSEDLYTGGFRAKVFFDQLFYDTSEGTLGFNGPGVGLGYDFPARGSSDFGILARGDFVSDSSVKITIFRLAFTYAFQY